MVGKRFSKAPQYNLSKLLFMNRGNTYSSAFKWENCEINNPGGSLIIGNPSNLPPYSSNNHPQPSKSKLSELGFKNVGISRHASEEEFKKIHNHRQPPSMVNSDNNFHREQEYYNQNKNIFIDKSKTSEQHLKTNSKPKVPEKEHTFFKARNSGGKASNPLKETSSTSSTDVLQTHKSEKTFPSFIRNQTKSPGKYKINKQGIQKEHFKIIRRLGEGKFGTVFLAKEYLSGMIVALKVVQKKKILKQNLLVQFIRELKIQHFLDHPNIIKNYGFFHDEDNFYTIMELGSDGQLYDIIADGLTLSEESTSFIVGNLLDAINLMHSHKILHRDIKPENIVLVHGNVKLCDFGWAVNKKEELRSTFCGTPLYLSPELLQGSKYDEKVDLWAIGVLAFQLYFGTSPFNISEQTDLFKIVTDEIQFPAKKKVSKEFKDFLYAILKKNPKDRMGCKQLIGHEFIKKYRELETCEELCQNH